MKLILKTKKKACGTFIFSFLGFFSTMPILSLCNVPIFNIFMFFCFIFLIVTMDKTIKLDKEILIILFFTIINTGINFLSNELPETYKHSMLLSSIFYILMYLVSLFLLNEFRYIELVMKGFEWSCVVQIIWCLIQIVMYEFMGIDLNKIIFIDFLNGNPEDQYSHYRYGELVCTGLHKHSANLIPIILYLYLKTEKRFLKLLCIFVAFYTKSTTMILAICVCIAYDFFIYLKRRFSHKTIKINLKKIAFLLVSISVVLFFISHIIEFLLEIYDYVFFRIEGLESENDSSGVHLDYYYLLPSILKSMPFINILFGYGTGCSGLPYSRLIGQYEDMVWVVESDIINTLINNGIIGFILFYLLMFKIFIKLRRERTKESFLVLLLIGCGVLYNVQYMWFLFIQICMMGNKEKILQKNNMNLFIKNRK